MSAPITLLAFVIWYRWSLLLPNTPIRTSRIFRRLLWFSLSRSLLSAFAKPNQSDYV